MATDSKTTAAWTFILRKWRVKLLSVLGLKHAEISLINAFAPGVVLLHPVS